ncbi:collagenase [Rheinheimera sp. 4Y26]|uniref:collagenase n=1 Tax=Rheinheimera sp. 4Y26 TaxID=2977811 RepID=UPI0021B0EFF1|nr:collagenase [Rheinheimera sp. 4Y26]MCT6700775.1 collagenase [Rheinheimera sp. 4Y26]
MYLSKTAVLSAALLWLNAAPVVAGTAAADAVTAEPATTGTSSTSVSALLTQVHQCSATLQLRSAALTDSQESQICQQLSEVEQRFQHIFENPSPVSYDGNHMLRANIYASQPQYAAYAGQHFLMPTNNGGMYLEGLPHQAGNQAEFVAYQHAGGAVWNLAHEYVHYLDGRFNLFGDFCANLHDSHAAPENCPRPAPQSPYLVWWTEGMAEYLAHGDNNQAAIKLAKEAGFALSALFHTGYESNSGSDRIYRWGYLAVRYMFEKQRNKLDQMLQFTRNGDYPRYQALVLSWGSSMDEDFALWLQQLATASSATTKPTATSP